MDHLIDAGQTIPSVFREIIDEEPAIFPSIVLIRSPALVKTFTLSSVVAPTIGLAYVAGMLKENGFSVTAIDAVGEALYQYTPLSYCDGYSIGLTMQEVVERIPAGSDIIGFSCMFSSSWPYDHRLISTVRESFPDALIVVGGEHVTACSDYILSQCPDVDICVCGEGEQIMLDIATNSRAGLPIDDISGIVFRKEGQIVANERRARISEIDQLPRPAWDLFPIENYLDQGLGHGVSSKGSMPLMASRGCPYQCTFCSSPQMWTTKWLARTPTDVVDEMEEYIQRYGAENFDLYDLTMIIKKEWILEFTDEIISRNLSIEYQLPSGTRSEAIDAEVSAQLYRSGCRQMNYGVESGSRETLAAVKKKVKIPRLLESLSAAVDNGLRVALNMIFFPNDTWRDVAKSFKFMAQCAWRGADDINMVPYVPYPGAELYNNMVSEGRISPMSEEYFVELLNHSVINRIRSYNKSFSTWEVAIIRLTFLGSFYGLSFLTHPGKFFGFAANVIRNKPQTRGQRNFQLIIDRVRRLM